MEMLRKGSSITTMNVKFVRLLIAQIFQAAITVACFAWLIFLPFIISMLMIHDGDWQGEQRSW